VSLSLNVVPMPLVWINTHYVAMQPGKTNADRNTGLEIELLCGP
jgi:hypothetical protein